MRFFTGTIYHDGLNPVMPARKGARGWAIDYTHTIGGEPTGWEIRVDEVRDDCLIVSVRREDERQFCRFPERLTEFVKPKCSAMMDTEGFTAVIDSLANGEDRYTHDCVLQAAQYLARELVKGPSMFQGYRR